MFKKIVWNNIKKVVLWNWRWKMLELSLINVLGEFWRLMFYILGDEVLEWNGIPLQGKSFQEVADIIAQSKQEPQVELVVTRNLYLSTTHGGPTSMTTTTTPIASRRLASQTQWKQKNESIPPTPLQLHHKGDYTLPPCSHPTPIVFTQSPSQLQSN